jgi:hypothetical protein
VAKARAPLREKIAALGIRFPNAIAYQARDSAELSIDAQRLGATFSDADLAELVPLAAAVTRMDLSGTAVTDAAVTSLEKFDHLVALRLNDTHTGDALLDAIPKLPRLTSLTIVGTRATTARVAQLRQRGLRVYDAR